MGPFIFCWSGRDQR